MIKIQFSSISNTLSGTIVLLAPENEPLHAPAAGMKDADLKKIREALTLTHFTGKKGSSEVLIRPAGLNIDRLVIVGTGKGAAITPLIAEQVGGAVYAKLATLGVAEATVVLSPIKGCPVREDELATHLATGAKLRSYSFEKYKTKKKDDAPKIKLARLTVATAEYGKARKLFGVGEKLAEAVAAVRDLQNEPANIIYPETLAQAAVDLLTPHGVKVTVLGEKEMKKLGMAALLGVGQGSARESKCVLMEYQGIEKNNNFPLALVGKGVTFDTGGISIKPSANMEDMKWDMGGSAVVIGTLLALASRKAKVNVAGAIGLVENMPSGTAQRPGDVVKSLSGQTIEVLNTDAEGRLVLADVLWHAQETWKPKTVIDLATLTGAIVVALGEITGGLFSNNDKLAEALFQAGEDVGEHLWRLPLREDYDKDIDCDIADMKNIGSGRGGGSITAAQFLQRFIQPGVQWGHLDIAGVTWTKKDTFLCPKGTTAFGLRILDSYIRNVWEG